MRALSLWQPWASLWLSPAKVHETRHWRTHIRGTVVVHASKTKDGLDDANGWLDEILVKYYGSDWLKEMPFGALIGTVQVVDCYPTDGLIIPEIADEDRECGNFGPNRFLFKRDAFRRFATPIPYRGAQGFFDVPDDVLRDA